MEDLKEIKEELARLRERVAVLESRPQAAPYVAPNTPWPNSFPYPNTVPYPGWPPGTITCEAKGAQSWKS